MVKSGRSPALMEDAKHAVEQAHALCFEGPGFQQLVIRGDLVEGNIKGAVILLDRMSALSPTEALTLQGCQITRPTLGSAPDATLCARTTRCTNLIQHILTVGGAWSQIRSIFCLIETIFSHVMVSYPLLMLVACQVSQNVHPKNTELRAVATYVHLNASGYMLAAVCITLRRTWSSRSVSTMDSRVAST
jgi:hypothetical protein